MRGETETRPECRWHSRGTGSGSAPRCKVGAVPSWEEWVRVGEANLMLIVHWLNYLE